MVRKEILDDSNSQDIKTVPPVADGGINAKGELDVTSATIQEVQLLAALREDDYHGVDVSVLETD